MTFIGDLFSMMSINTGQLKVTSAAYFCSYVVLILVGLYRIRGFNFKGLVGAYLIVVFLLNAYFMYSLFGMLSYNIANGTDLFFTSLEIIALVVLGFIAFRIFDIFITKDIWDL